MLRVLTCFRNAEAWLPRCIASIAAQTLTDWRCHLVDDASTDGSFDVARRLTAGDPRFEVVRNATRRYTLGNVYSLMARPDFDDDDVAVALDGDDWFADDGVLARVAAAYADPSTWITYGQFVFWDGPDAPSRPGFAAPIADPARARQLPWTATHLKTWKAFLWRRIRRGDLLGPDGGFWEAACDQAFMLPMIEMAGTAHARFLPEVSYVYNQETPLNEFKVAGDQPRICMDAIRRLAPHAALPDRPAPTASPADGRVTVVISPRERFSQSRRAFEALLAHTPAGCPLVYVACGMPADLGAWFARASQALGFTLVTSPEVLLPNRARALGLPHVRTPYVVFVDNDAEVTPGWIDALVRCADETGALAVGPLYLEGDPALEVIHMAGGDARRERVVRQDAQGREIVTDLLHVPHRHLRRRVADVADQLRREACHHVEFHTMLLATDFCRTPGVLADGLMSLHEHVHVGMLAEEAGGAVWFEPASRVTYHQPPPWEPSDVGFFLRRWSDEWNRASCAWFDARWGVETTSAATWAKGFRRRLLGSLQVPARDAAAPSTPLEHAMVMLAVLDCAGRTRFDVRLRGLGGRTETRLADRSLGDLVDALPAVLNDAAARGLRVTLRPVASDEPSRALVHVSGLDAESRTLIDTYALVVVETGPSEYEGWIAVGVDEARTFATRLAAALSGTRARAALEGEGTLAGSPTRGGQAGVVAARADRASTPVRASVLPEVQARSPRLGEVLRSFRTWFYARA